MSVGVTGEPERAGLETKPVRQPQHQDSAIPPGLNNRRLRTARYVQALGAIHGRWLSFREALGDRREVSVRRRGRRLAIRLGTTDILVWHSVFTREDYGIELARPPQTIIDAGAYTGFSAIYFAEKYAAATILALEPEPSNFALLLRNICAYPNIIPINRALWSRECRMGLRGRSAGHWSFYILPEASAAHPLATQVETATVETLMAQLGVDYIDLLKIDVEGAEKEIFEHSSGWIGRVGAVLAELHDRFNPGCTEAFNRATASFERTSKHAMTVCAINPVGRVPS